MTARKVPRRGPIVVPTHRALRRRVRTPRDEVLGPEALDAPVPGSLLVLLSRLARSERKAGGDGKDGA